MGCALLGLHEYWRRGRFLRETIEDARESFVAAMDDDFNTSSVLAVLFELVKAINTAHDQGVAGPFYEAAQRTLGELAGVLGVTLTAPAVAATASVDGWRSPLSICWLTSVPRCEPSNSGPWPTRFATNSRRWVLCWKTVARARTGVLKNRLLCLPQKRVPNE